MNFNDITIPEDLDSVNITDKNDIVSDSELYNFELDFVETYEDTVGILHIKTSYAHEDIDETELWEFFSPKDGSQSLELLLNN